MEYAGEIITEEECERRMNEVYRNNEVCRNPDFPSYVFLQCSIG
jgi:histone-lysine N-methyltransferase ASH1L